MRTYGRCTAEYIAALAASQALSFTCLCKYRLHMRCTESEVFALGLQVAAKDLPQLLKELQPLIPTASAKPVHTEDFEDGRRIPSLKELLLEARAPVYQHNLAAQGSCSMQ